jgi:hypothetical protein
MQRNTADVGAKRGGGAAEVHDEEGGVAAVDHAGSCGDEAADVRQRAATGQLVIASDRQLHLLAAGQLSVAPVTASAPTVPAGILTHDPATGVHCVSRKHPLVGAVAAGTAAAKAATT